jgi:hypothetical protein
MGLLKRSGRVVADTAVGYVLLGAGIVMLVTPGPGIVAIVAGLAILARHWAWAERLKHAVVGRIRDAGTRLRARRAAHRATSATMPTGRDPDAGERDAADAA